MTTTTEHPDQADEAWKVRLSRAAARRARAEAEFYATVAELGRGVSQSQMATVLHTSQANVSRWAAKGHELAAQIPPGRLARSGYEVAQRYAVGEISREQMREALISWPWGPGPEAAPDLWNAVPVQEQGSFETEVGRAYDDRLISAEDYDAILTALAH
jgi:hypothetical protein